MPLETVPFDAARYFTNEDDQAELLTDALETGEAGYFAAALGTIARVRTPDDADDTPPRRATDVGSRLRLSRSRIPR